MRIFSKFWAWYERHHRIATAIAAGLFALQLIHLYWLTTDVVLAKIFGTSFFPDTNALIQFLLVIVDYTEIPALITASLVYIRLFRENHKFKNILYLIFLNLQFVHIFWITDEYVVSSFTTQDFITWNPFLAWIAIGIDYLELPVIFETIKQTIKNYWPKKQPSGLV